MTKKHYVKEYERIIAEFQKHWNDHNQPMVDVMNGLLRAYEKAFQQIYNEDILDYYMEVKKC